MVELWHCPLGMGRSPASAGCTQSAASLQDQQIPGHSSAAEFPRIQLTYPTQHDIIGQHLRELAPFLTEVLQNRQHPKLHLTLQPAFVLLLDIDERWLVDAIEERQNEEPDAAAADAMQLVAWTLGAVPLCEAVDCLTISWDVDSHLPWEPEFSAALAASFPSLTSLTFKDVRLSISDLAQAINHPLLLPRLLHLDLLEADITDEGDLGRSPFIGSRLQKLSLPAANDLNLRFEPEFLSGLLPLPPTLTQLEVSSLGSGEWSTLAAVMSSLTQLQELSLSYDCNKTGSEPMELLLAPAHLPSLHTLFIDEYVEGQEQLDALLALTQITCLEVYGFSGLTSSWASADCSWRRLKVRQLDWVTAAYLPLHSLTHPLRLHQLVKDVEDPSIEVLAAAEFNLCERNKAGLEVNVDMCLSKATVDLLTEQYLTHRCRIAQQRLQSSVASSSHSGPSTSLASSSSPEGHITPEGQGSSTGPGGQQGGSVAGGQALMQRLGRRVKQLYIIVKK
ncbi:hypothetical protein QJQ45_010693 [Haematococcus lacustris]|nr:hypothetical protein QJQ45_010693 [Haematococcus lacustris]